jgi:thioesterase domain-containing protein
MDGQRAEVWAAALHEACGVCITAQEVMASRTLRELGWRIRAAAYGQARERLRSFAGGAGAVSLFFVDGDPNGLGLYCTRLARALGSGVALHALTSHGPYGPAPVTGIPAMAAFHIETLRTVQPRGPYLLGGFCLGGIVAFEMARQLEAQGERVTRVVMIGPTVWSRFWGWRRVCGAVAAGLRLPRGVEEALFFAVRDRAQPWFARWDRYRARRHGVPRGLFPHVPRLRALPRDWWNMLKGRPERVSRERRRDDLRRADPREEARVRFWADVVRRVRLSVPVPWAGPTLILWPERDRLFRFGDPQATWSRVASRLEVRPVPGGHCDCLIHHVEDVAREIRAGLGVVSAGEGPAGRIAA